MKKALSPAVALTLCCTLAACGQSAVSAPAATAAPTPSAAPTAAPIATVEAAATPAPTDDAPIRLRLTFDGGEAVVALYDNAASADLLTLLPLEVSFEDYNATEKIATLPRSLTTAGAPDGFEPRVGDFAYYAPWGNLSVFYRDFRYSEQLVSLGVFESGLEEMTALSGSFTVNIEIFD